MAAVQLKAEPATPDMPVIALTALALKGDEEHLARPAAATIGKTSGTRSC